MKFKFRNNWEWAKRNVKYKTYTFGNHKNKLDNLPLIALRGEIWVCEDEFIKSTTGNEWRMLKSKIDKAKLGVNNGIKVKRVDGKNYFKATLVFTIEPINE